MLLKLNLKSMKKNKYYDDGHTIYNMDIDGLPKREKKVRISIDKEERKVIMKAGLRTYLPLMIIIVICFCITFLLVYLWLG